MDVENNQGPESTPEKGPDQSNLNAASMPSEFRRALAASTSGYAYDESNLGIDRDRNRFREIIRKQVRKDFKDLIKRKHLDTRGDGTIRIPIDRIDLPHFRHSQGDGGGGVGQGDGDVGDQIGQGQPQPGGGEAGQDAGEPKLEEVLTKAELAQLLGEQLKLPRIKPKGNDDAVETDYAHYSGISRRGPDSLRDTKRTFKRALRRQISTGEYDPENPQVIPIKEDFRFKAPELRPKPKDNAAIIFLMDISGSMGEEQRDIARTTSFWLTTWLDSQYQNCEQAYVVHDTRAQEVDRDSFFRLSQGGGTMISSGYNETLEVIRSRFPIDEWNLYVFQFSDGDNWGDDDRQCIDLMRNQFLKAVNLFGYVQVKSRHGSGEYFETLSAAFPDREELICSQIDNRGDIPDALKELLGEGR